MRRSQNVCAALCLLWMKLTSAGNNCVKNAVLCEGYPEKTVWQPGRQRHSDGTLYQDDWLVSLTEGIASALLSASLSIVPCPKPCLPTLVEGVDDMLDRKLLSHFTVNLSRVLTLFSDKTNPFVSLLLPMAAQKPALMHSLLCVSSSHLWTRTNQRNVEYLARQDYHFSKAVKFFWMDVMPSREADPETADCATAITMLFCLDTIAKGDTQGQYKVHLQSAGPLYRASLEVYRRAADQRHGTEFNKFLWEFFAYHDVLNSITSLEHRPGWFQNIVLPGFVPGAAGALLGVFDGLFSFLSRITVLRDEIRRRRALHENPSEFLVLEDGLEIDLALRQWQPQVTQEQDPLRFFSSQLYRQCTWVYLYRTIKPSHPTSKVTEAVDTGLEYLRILPEESGAQSILLLPLFLLGCAAFEPRQRPEISRRFEGLYKWSGLGNIEPAHAVVKRMWVLMDEGDMDRTWDWEQIMKDMGQDFLVT